MHHVYDTPSIILSTQKKGDKDLLCEMFSRDFGKIHAVAIGAKTVHSKLRASLRPYSITRTSLVRGKAGWRITGSMLGVCLSDQLREQREVLEAAARVIGLISRLVVDEQESHAVYDVLVSYLEKLVQRNIFDDKDSLEVMAVASILATLGYLPHSLIPKEGEVELNVGRFQSSRKSELIIAVNRALRDSHL